MNYEIPVAYRLPREGDRLHHCRPRFRDDIENVLSYMSYGIADLLKDGPIAYYNFKTRFDSYIRTYGANATATNKTISNWRTEISSLLGMCWQDGGVARMSKACLDLANSSNLKQFFLGFIYSFQYPGGHVNDANKTWVDAGVTFHPGRWLSKFFLENRDQQLYITAEEFCHCVMNDLRVSRDDEDVAVTYARIRANRLSHVIYDSASDTIRYARDVLDYFVLAGLGLTKTYRSETRYLLDERAAAIVQLIADTAPTFHGYDGVDVGQSKVLKMKRPEWFNFVDLAYQDLINRVHAISAASSSGESVENLPEQDAHSNTAPSGSSTAPESSASAPMAPATPASDDTAWIGECGENLVYQHECLRISEAGLSDYTHLIKRIPTHLAAGYDIKSLEILDLGDRMIEVKTSVSKTPLSFNRVHLTSNEWRVAESLRSRYFIYRLQITDDGRKLFILRDPVGLYKNNLITMVPRDGADIQFTDAVGEYTELLCVQ